MVKVWYLWVFVLAYLHCAKSQGLCSYVTVGVTPRPPSCWNSTGSFLIVVTATPPIQVGTVFYYINGTAYGGVPGPRIIPVNPGTYGLEVRSITTDGSTCTSSFSNQVIGPPPSRIIPNVVSVQNVSCPYENNTGNVILSATGGTGGLVYSLDGSNFQFSPNFTNVINGSYTPVVRDSNSCFEISNTSITISVPPAPTVTAVGTNVPCFTTSNSIGDVSLFAYGGVGDFTYSIDNGTTFVTSSSFKDLAPGIYQPVIKDKNQCIYRPLSFTFVRPPALLATISYITPATCATQGAATIYATGGNTSNSYLYSVDGVNFTSLSTREVPRGWFTVIVKDASECRQSVTGYMPAFTRMAVVVDEDAAKSTGVFNPSVSGGNPPYTFYLNGTVISGTTINTPGRYQWEVRDDVDCVQSGTIDIGIQNSTQKCSIGNGGCPYNTRCTDMSSGGVMCSSCPIGSFRNGSICQSYCGDNFCDYSVFEDCVTCSSDCTAPCGICGDGVCDTRETCSSCAIDCGSCVKPSCDCNANAICSANGRCMCFGQQSGPSCSDSNSDVNVTFDSNSPNVIVASRTASFPISITSITEMNPTYAPVQTTLVSQLNFTLPKMARGISAVNTVHNYSALLTNGASILVSITEIEQDTNTQFAGISTTILANSLRLSVRISNWPFFSLRNNIQIAFNSLSGGCIATQESTLNSILSLVSVTNGIPLYVQLMDKVVIEGRAQTISYFMDSNNTLTATIPHFWSSAEMEAHFSVLSGNTDIGTCGPAKPSPSPSSSPSPTGNPSPSPSPPLSTDSPSKVNNKKSTNNKAVKIAVPIVVIGVVAVAAVAGFLFYRHRSNKPQRVLSNSQSVEMNST